MKANPLLGLTVLLAHLAAATPAAGASTGTEQRLDFNVYLDDSRIGEHRFVLDSRGETAHVRSEANFEVKLLFVTAYEYSHRNRESWRGGCLESMDAVTDDNGERSSVSGSVSGGKFMVRTDDGSRRLDDCVGSFAYWDRKLLERGRLLNAQTGEHVAVELQPLGKDQLDLYGGTVTVSRYALRGEDIDVTVSYDVATGAWVALDTRVDGGRMLRYRLRPEPITADSDADGLDTAG